MATRMPIRWIAAAAAAAMLMSVSACGSSKATYEVTADDENAADVMIDNKPESPYWFPEDLLEWTPESDEDLAWNVSRVPLAKRVEDKAIAASNKTQNDKTKVMAISIMNSSTSGNLPRGSNTSDANTFTYWQYVDELVYWGGSAGEGIIVPPTPDVTDEGHMNGVPVIGTVFFPQDASGGKVEWLKTFLKQAEDGSFPMADKLIEVADTYGFDGWFINQETEGEDGELTAEDAKAMQAFIKYYKSKDADKRIVYYDSMTKDGKIDWQNALTDQNAMFMADENGEPVSDEMFLNFWWTEDELADQELLKASAAKAKEMGIDPYSLYAGVDVQANGVYTPIRWDLFSDENGETHVSLGLYCPNWAYTDARSLDEFHTNEADLWVNADHDPTAESKADSDSSWPGVSTYAKENTAITSLPFTTDFNTGSGYNYFRDGQRISQMDWNNRSVADVLPTYQWTVRNDKGNSLSASYDYTNAWRGGTSVKLKGNAAKSAASTIDLYATNVPLSGKTTLTVRAKAKAKTALTALLTFSDGSTAEVKGDASVGEDWTEVGFKLKEHAGKTLSKLSLTLTPEAEATGYELHLGHLSLSDGKADKPGDVTDVKVEDSLFDDDQMYAGARLTWKGDADAYEIYRVNADKSRAFLGTTNVENFYVNALKRHDETNRTEFLVVPVNAEGTQGKGGEATMEWPDNSKPKAAMSASRTLVTPGTKITFTSQSSSNTESVSWALPGSDTETAEGKEVEATYDKEGVYDVTVTAKNDSGTDEQTIKGAIVVSADAPSGDLTLLSQGASTEATAFVNDNEAPPMAVDGKTSTKWCATGEGPHELVIDLGGDRTVSQVDIAHASAGGEDKGMNTMKYALSVSSDGQEFTTVKEVRKNAEANTSDTFAPVNARYVKLTVTQGTQGTETTARIYEVQVFGSQSPLL